jgi:hypothetical protein
VRKTEPVFMPTTNAAIPNRKKMSESAEAKSLMNHRRGEGHRKRFKIRMLANIATIASDVATI